MDELTYTASTVDKLAAALAKAQGEFKAVQKTGRNPHLRNEYATLDDIIGAIRAPLAKHGLSFVQLLGSNGEGVTLRTVLLHESGQQLESTVVVDSAEQKGISNLQALGAAITYMKRYSLSAMLGIAADVDTDGEGANAQPRTKPNSQEHAPESPPESPAQAGVKFKVAAVKTTNWATRGAEFARATPYYMKGDQIDWYHLTGAAAKCGFGDITDENMDAVLDALRTYANREQEKAAGQKELPL